LSRANWVQNNAAGGIFLPDRASKVVNCVVAGNGCYDPGAGIYHGYAKAAEIRNCTVINNVSAYRAGAGVRAFSTYTTIKDCIIWGQPMTSPATITPR